MTSTHVVLIVLGVLALLYACFGLPRSKAAPPATPQAGLLDPVPPSESNPESTSAPSADLSEVYAALDRGEMVPAVKAYRDATGAGLLEAKQAVDRLIEGDPTTGNHG